MDYESIIKVRVTLNNSSSVRLSVKKEDAELLGMEKSGEIWFIKVLKKAEKIENNKKSEEIDDDESSEEVRQG